MPVRPASEGMRRGAVLTAALLIACAPHLYAQTPEPSRAGYLQTLLASVEGESMPPSTLLAPWIARDEADGGARNRVLNEMEAGAAAFAAGYFKHAEALFNDGQQQIETIYADNAAAQAARSKFVPEASKDFKGDPYERAMVGYYLGLIDLAKGDYDNARAGFRFALLQDTMSASEVYQDDMAAMQYLIGWSYWCEGNLQSAKEEFTRAQTMRPGLAAPQTGHNLLMIGELGNAPVKVASGRYNELLSYRAGAPNAMQRVAFAVGDKQWTGQLAEDLYFQASTRGGTAVEHIRAGKASFRQSAETIAKTASGIANVAVGAAYLSAVSGNQKTARNLLGVGLVSGMVNLVSDSVAKSTETAADARAWTSLPAEIYLATGTATSAAQVEAGFFGTDGKLLQSQVMLKRTAPKGQCSLAYAKAGKPKAPQLSADASKWKPLPAIASAADTRQAAPVTAKADKSADISEEGSALLDMVRMMRENPNAAIGTLPEKSSKTQ